MSNFAGRQVVVLLTNKSGGGVAAGDVVIVDASNNAAFTTTTSAGFTGGVGIAQETIASNATGRVLIGGYAALVNVSASVTRGDYGKTHTVAKQAVSAGSARGTGTFCQFLTGGTTPTALVFPVDLLGSSLTNPMTTQDDIIIAAAAGAPDRLPKGNAGGVLAMGNGHVIWNAGTSFPGSKATNDRYWRTDLGMGFYWDGAQWLCTCEHVVPFGGVSGVSASTVGGRLSSNEDAGLDLWLEHVSIICRVNTTNNGTNFWTIDVYKFNAAGTGTLIAQRSTGTGPDTAGTFISKKVSVGAVVDVSVSIGMYFQATKVLSPGTCDANVSMHYRFIGT